MSRNSESFSSASPMRRILEALDARRVTYFLDSGTLLGIIRDNDLIQWDSDIDLGTLRSSLPNLVSALDDLRSQGFTYRWHSYFGVRYVVSIYSPSRSDMFLPVTVRPYFQHANLLVGPQSKRLLKVVEPFPSPTRLTRRAQFYRAMSRSSAVSAFRRSRFGRLNVIDRGRLADGKIIGGTHVGQMWEIPADLIFPLRRIELSDMEVAIPGESLGYLSYRYGPDWKTPNSDWRFWRDDGAIRNENPRLFLQNYFMK